VTTRSRRGAGAAAFAAVSILLAPMAHSAATPPDKKPADVKASSKQEQKVRSFPLNKYKRELDGQWQGIRLASDGNVYFASSTHSAHHGASFFKYDTKTGQITELVHDITEACGEDAATNPQGKIHSDVVEANGWLYMATHFSSEKPGAFKTWTGSHALGYELATGKMRDYGVIKPGFTAYSAVGVDPKRNYLYVFLLSHDASLPSCVYRIDTVSGEKKELGQASAPGGGGLDNGSFWMFVDQRGDAWFSVKNQNGALQQIHGDTGRIEVHANALPPLVRWDDDVKETDPHQQAQRSIAWMQPLDGDRALLTLSPWGGMLYRFDATKPLAEAFTPLRHIGFNYLGGLALGGDRVYYYQRKGREFGNQEFKDFHLLSVSLDAAAGYPITDYGLLVDQDGRIAWRLPGMMADARGHVYMVGDWWTKPGDLGSLRYNSNRGSEKYDPLPRGEFFAVAEVPAP